MHHLHVELTALRGFNELQGPQRAGIDILPFQLEPALALIRGDASRFLLADEVGLGKTIEAGLILRELILRQQMKSIREELGETTREEQTAKDAEARVEKLNPPAAVASAARGA